MLPVFDCVRDITWLSVLVRMLAAFLIGGAIGIERSYKNRPAGFRTHILVCIGAAAASMTGLYLYLNLKFPTDLSRIGAQVVSGLGFIGGGTIFVTKQKTIKGLTTAAGLWVTGIIGLAVGAGFYEGALIAMGMVLITEIFFSDIGHKIKRTQEFQLEIVYREKTALDRFLRFCKNNRFSILNLSVTSTDRCTAVITLSSRKFTDAEVLIRYAKETSEIESVKALESQQG